MTTILVCNPQHYSIDYEINPWMSIRNPADRDLAISQWHGLIALLKRIEVNVVEMQGQPGLPDMVFTANAGLVFQNKKVVLSNFKYPQRRPERKFYKEWFEANGYEIIETFTPEFHFEGAGDALFREQSNEQHFDNKLYFGYGFRSDYDAVTHKHWGDIWREHTQYLQLIDPYFYHLDTCFCPLKDNFALIWPGAFREDTIDSIECWQSAFKDYDGGGSGLELLKVPEEDARKFACNAVAIGNKVIIPSGCDTTKRLLLSVGFEVFDTDMSEFIKAGGACKCLTLRLE